MKTTAALLFVCLTCCFVGVAGCGPSYEPNVDTTKDIPESAVDATTGDPAAVGGAETPKGDQ